jgi:hypothetical protein
MKRNFLSLYSQKELYSIQLRSNIGLIDSLMKMIGLCNFL